MNDKNIETMNDQDITHSNKAFVEMLFKNKLTLKNYPERVADNFVLYEPKMLPFGGVYNGLGEYENIAIPKIADFYDFSRFEYVGAYADGNVVFGLLKIGLKGSHESMSLCEQFTFEGEKITQIKVFILD